MNFQGISNYTSVTLTRLFLDFTLSLSSFLSQEFQISDFRFQISDFRCKIPELRFQLPLVRRRPVHAWKSAYRGLGTREYIFDHVACSKLYTSCTIKSLLAVQHCMSENTALLLEGTTLHIEMLRPSGDCTALQLER